MQHYIRSIAMTIFNMHLSSSIRFIILPLLFVQYYTPTVRSQVQCKLSMKTSFHANSPVLIDNQLNTLYPSSDNPSQLVLPWFQDRLIYCPGSFKGTKNNLQWQENAIMLGTTTLPKRPSPMFFLPPVVRCINDQIFELEDGQHQHLELHQLSCARPPDTTVWFTGRPCPRGEIVMLGFALDQHMKKGTISICYVDSIGTTTWSAAIIRGGVAGRQTNGKAGSFSKDVLFKDISIASYYEGCEQVKTFMSIFRDVVFKTPPSDDLRYPDGMTQAERKDFETKQAQLKTYVQRYIQDSKDLPDDMALKDMNSFDKGHLVARADMLYAAEQYTTMFYGNVLPMWLSINRGNWKDMEDQVRNLAAAKGDLHVVVGGIGVLQLENRDIYIARRKDKTERMVPAPKVLFKLVVSEKFNQGIVFIAVNNPYVQQHELVGYSLCQEYAVCRQLMPKFSDMRYGFIYCCRLQDFMANIAVQNLGLPISVRQDVMPIV